MNNPTLIALVRAIETTVIASLASAVLLVAPQIQLALASPEAARTFDWRGVILSVIIGTLAGCFQSLTAYITAAQKNTQAIANAVEKPALHVVLPAAPNADVQAIHVEANNANVSVTPGGP